jgi:flagellar hook-associated protein 1 FlgK
MGQAVDTANTQVTDQTNVQTIVTNQRNSVSGVSLDQEMSHLLTYQTAYQASSELFSTINSMMSELVTALTSAP